MSYQKKGLNRNTIDKFYTNELICQQIYKYITEHIQIDEEKDIIIEPSAGNGSFINTIKLLCKNYIFIDIEPEHKEIIKQDFLTFNFSKLIGKYRKIHIIGNPPFGRQSSKAIKFIKYCSQFADTISFILPKSFKKESLKNKIPLNYHCIYQIDLPPNSFIVNSKEYDVSCVFQIQDKKNYIRSIKDKLKPLNYKFVKKTENPDLSFRRVGVKAGFISLDCSKSAESHYFLKFDDKNILSYIINKMGKMDFPEKNNTIGPKSISKQELIEQLNNFMNKD